MVNMIIINQNKIAIIIQVCFDMHSVFLIWKMNGFWDLLQYQSVLMHEKQAERSEVMPSITDWKETSALS